MIIDTKLAYAVLWSYAQNCFHVEEIEDMVKANTNAYLKNKELTYITLGVFPNRQACSNFIDELRALDCESTRKLVL